MTSAMSTFDSGKEGLQDLLTDIDGGDLQLPDFQRDWRWDDEHVQSLLASVSLSYPIGAVLLMETGGEVRFRPRAVSGAVRADGKGPKRLILDGQQRLTALYQVLRSGSVVHTRDHRNNHIARWYYLDIDKTLNPNTSRDEAIVSVPEDKVVTYRRQVIIDLSDRDKECAAGCFPLSILFDTAQLFQWLDHYAFHCAPELQEERRQKRNTLIQEVIGRFQQYQIPVIELKQHTPKDAVCNVFEKVNTGGVALNVFELVTASFAAEGYSLRDDWDARRRELHRYDQLQGVDSSAFLTAATLLSAWRKHQEQGQTSVSCKRQDVLNLELADYLRVAEPLMEGLRKTARFLLRENIFRDSDVPYQTQIVPLAAVLAALNQEAEKDSVKARLARWYWCGVFGELYGSAVESRFARDLPEMIDWIHGGNLPATIQDSSFVPQRLLTLRTRLSAAYKGLHAMLMHEGAVDLRTGDPITLQTYFDDAVDVHHLFPQVVCREWGISPDRYNSIANKTPIASRTNRIIGGDRPSSYLARLEEHGPIPHERMDEFLRSHLINPEPLRRDDFDAFFGQRQEALLSLIEKATGNRILRQAEEDDFGV